MSPHAQLAHPARPANPGRPAWPLSARWAILACFLTGLLALGSPAAHAQSNDGLLEATATLRLGVPVSDLEFVYAAPTTAFPGTTIAIPSGPGCGANHFTPLEDYAAFRFHEASNENGCGEAQYTVDLPVGTRSLYIRFDADRIVAQPTQATVTNAFVQEVRWYGDDLTLSGSHRYTDPADENLALRQTFENEQPVATGQRQATVAWYFQDAGNAVGGGLTGTAVGHEASSTVVGPVLEMRGIPIAQPAVDIDRTGVVDGEVLYRTRMTVRLPAFPMPGGITDVRLRIDPSLDFTGASTLDGRPVPAARLQEQQRDGVVELVVQGDPEQPGNAGYQLFFSSARPVLPTPSLYPVAVLALLLPAVAASFAYGSARRFDAEVPRAFAATGRTLHWNLRIFILGYALLLGWILLRRSLPLMATTPLEIEAGAIYVAVTALVVGLLVLAYLWRRNLHLITAAEMAEKEKANRELERSNKELAQFAYVASHDLQEPLRMVASYTELLRRRYKGKLDADADEFIDYAIDGSERMQRLINDLLTYSRVGTQGRPFAPVDLNDVVEVVRQNLDLAIQDAKGRVEAERLPTVQADETQMVQLLQNLVANAIKFHGPKPPIVRITCAETRDDWVLSVQDNGIGIDPAEFGKLFVIFQRLGNRHDHPGTGIGLAVCKRILERHGGRIWVESTPGQGSTFKCQLPKSPPRTESAH